MAGAQREGQITGRRVLGEGGSLGIWEGVDGTLTLGMPVASGFVSADFAVGPEMRDALAVMPRKALALELALHDRLRSRLMRGVAPVANAEIHALIAAVVRLDAAGVEAFACAHRLGPMMERTLDHRIQ